jgi:hypothetical protein
MQLDEMTWLIATSSSVNQKMLLFWIQKESFDDAFGGHRVDLFSCTADGGDGTCSGTVIFVEKGNDDTNMGAIRLVWQKGSRTNRDSARTSSGPVEPIFPTRPFAATGGTLSTVLANGIVEKCQSMEAAAWYHFCHDG